MKKSRIMSVLLIMGANVWVIRNLGYTIFKCRYYPSFLTKDAVFMFFWSSSSFVIPILFYLLILNHYVFIIRELVYLFFPGSTAAQFLTALWFIAPFSLSSEFDQMLEMPPVKLEDLLDPFELAELLGVPEEELFKGFNPESLSQSSEESLDEQKIREKERQELYINSIKDVLIFVVCMYVFLKI